MIHIKPKVLASLTTIHRGGAVKKGRLVVALVGTLALVAPAMASASVQIHTVASYTSSSYGWCLDDTNWSRTPAQYQLQLYQCLNPVSQHQNQQWYMQWLNYTPCLGNSGNTCSIYLIHSQFDPALCVDDWGNSYGQSKAILYPCNRNNQAQQMEFQQKTYQEGLMQVSAYEISHYGAANCLDNSGDILANGNHVQFYPCNGTNAQGWWLY